MPIFSFCEKCEDNMVDKCRDCPHIKAIMESPIFGFDRHLEHDNLAEGVDIYNDSGVLQRVQLERL